MINFEASKSDREGKPDYLRPLSPAVWIDMMDSEDRCPVQDKGPVLGLVGLKGVGASCGQVYPECRGWGCRPEHSVHSSPSH